MGPRETVLRQSMRRYALSGAVVLGVLTAAVAGWAASTSFSGAVISQGQLVVDSNSKKVQHLVGGTVAELRVRDGDRVKAGDVVIKLDETQLRANLTIINRTIDELMARRARSESERDDEPAMQIPGVLAARRGDPDVARIVEGEARLFDSRRNARNAKKALLQSRLAQLEEEVNSLNSQLTSKTREIAWVRRELNGVRELWDKKLVQITRLAALEREQAKIEGDQGALTASIAQARGRITDLAIQVMQIDEDLHAEAGKDLAELRLRLAELFEKRVAAEDQLVHLELRAPRDGIVHQLDVHTVGGVISPGQQAMIIVPEADDLKVEARVQPHDVDQLSIGQTAMLRFAASNQRTTPEIRGAVDLVSADVTQDQKTGLSYYTIRITIPAAERSRLEGMKLVPGMPVDVFVQTTSRTVLSFLMRPLHDQVARAFREK